MNAEGLELQPFQLLRDQRDEEDTVKGKVKDNNIEEKAANKIEDEAVNKTEEKSANNII